MKKIILYLLITINIFSLTDYEKGILKKIKNVNYTCNTGKEKIIEINGKDFKGHINNKGEFYGELNFPEEDDIRYCFLKNEYKVYLPKKKRFYLNDFELKVEIIKQEDEKLYQYIDDGSVTVLEKKNRKFERKGGILLLEPESYKFRGSMRNKKEFFKYNKLKINEDEID
ncbi:MAG: hypothetical protein Q4D53_03205 [Leptotrichiaceae bacterium]|nr:hypothetical protein [Leptotrichiaceae bacterium]